MAKNKLQRYEEVRELDTVLEYTEFAEGGRTPPAGDWNDRIFEDPGPVVLELACGKGEYTLQLARTSPEINAVGIDIKGARIWKGATRAHREGLKNVRFLRIFIDHLVDYFAPGEVSQIWIPFPDPYLKETKSDKRLTSPKFLEIYQKVLEPGGTIHLKTDSPELWEYTLEVIRNERCELLDRVDDIYKERPGDELLTHTTYYERKHLAAGRTIRYVRFRLPDVKEA
ncbi:MAG: tRNA (guanosine(46)-N7)-methyltransferase TrmB [Balneolaceae bacterium]